MYIRQPYEMRVRTGADFSGIILPVAHAGADLGVETIKTLNSIRRECGQIVVGMEFPNTATLRAAYASLGELSDAKIERVAKSHAGFDYQVAFLLELYKGFRSLRQEGVEVYPTDYYVKTDRLDRRRDWQSLLEAEEKKIEASRHINFSSNMFSEPAHVRAAKIKRLGEHSKKMMRQVRLELGIHQNMHFLKEYYHTEIMIAVIREWAIATNTYYLMSTRRGTTVSICGAQHAPFIRENLSGSNVSLANPLDGRYAPISKLSIDLRHALKDGDEIRRFMAMAKLYMMVMIINNKDNHPQTRGAVEELGNTIPALASIKEVEDAYSQLQRLAESTVRKQT